MVQVLNEKYNMESKAPTRWKKIAQAIKSQCQTCQAIDPPNWSKLGNIVITLVPCSTFTHICLHLLKLPRVQHEGKDFDTVIVAVNHLSNWIIAIPTL